MTHEIIDTVTENASLILAGTITILIGWYLKLKGKQPIYLEEKDINQRMLICKQDIILLMVKELDKRDKNLIKHIKEIML